MAKTVHDDILDSALNYIKNNATRIAICSSQPTTYAELTTNLGSGGYKLAIKTITSSNFTGPADGDVSGRKLSKNEDATITVDITGTATYVGFGDSATSKLLYVTTCTSQSLTATNTVTIPLWKIEIADPS